MNGPSRRRSFPPLERTFASSRGEAGDRSSAAVPRWSRLFRSRMKSGDAAMILEAPAYLLTGQEHGRTIPLYHLLYGTLYGTLCTTVAPGPTGPLPTTNDARNRSSNAVRSRNISAARRRIAGPVRPRRQRRVRSFDDDRHAGIAHRRRGVIAMKAIGDPEPIDLRLQQARHLHGRQAAFGRGEGEQHRHQLVFPEPRDADLTRRRLHAGEIDHLRPVGVRVPSIVVEAPATAIEPVHFG